MSGVFAVGVAHMVAATAFSTILVEIDSARPATYLPAMPLTPEQCRAARAMLDWTQDRLASEAHVSRSTVRGFESRQHALHRATAAAIRFTLEAAGAVFLEPRGNAGPGVRLSRAATAKLAPPPAAPSNAES